jgi:predicted RNA binding protein YcfA (HicA-like mRNA interferase family)
MMTIKAAPAPMISLAVGFSQARTNGSSCQLKRPSTAGQMP